MVPSISEVVHPPFSIVRLHHNLSAAVISLLERVIHMRPVLHTAAMLDDEGRINLALLNHLHELADVVENIALPYTDRDALLECRAKR